MASRIRYHEMAEPLNPPPLPPQFSSLHNLYPGMPMMRDSFVNWNDYPVDASLEEASIKSFTEDRERTVGYGAALETAARLQGDHL